MLSLPVILQTARDLTLLGSAIYFVSKLKPLTESARDFFRRATDFMTKTETTMSVIQSNHLAHIQKSLEALVNDKDRDLQANGKRNKMSESE